MPDLLIRFFATVISNKPHQSIIENLKETEINYVEKHLSSHYAIYFLPALFVGFARKNCFGLASPIHMVWIFFQKKHKNLHRVSNENWLRLGFLLNVWYTTTTISSFFQFPIIYSWTDFLFEKNGEIFKICRKYLLASSNLALSPTKLVFPWNSFHKFATYDTHLFLIN